MDRLNAMYQLDEDTPTLKVRVYDKTSGFKLEEYNPVTHGGYTCNSTSFSTLGNELNTFPIKSLISDEWKGTFVQYSTSSCGQSHTPFLSLFEQRPWTSKNGSTVVLAPKIRFNMWGAIQPTQCLRWLRGAALIGDGICSRFMFCFDDPSRCEFAAVDCSRGYSAKQFTSEILFPIQMNLSVSPGHVLFETENAWDIGSSPLVEAKWLNNMSSYLFASCGANGLMDADATNKFKRKMSQVVNIVY
eukprot:58073_1